VPTTDTSAMSNADLLSMPVLQPVSPPATQNVGIMDMPNITQPMMGQPVGMTMCMQNPPAGGMTGMPNVMGASSVNMGVGMNMAMGTPQVGCLIALWCVCVCVCVCVCLVVLDVVSSLFM